MSNRRKRPRGRSLVALVVSAAVAVALIPGSSYADPEPTLEEVREQVKELEHGAELAAERSNEARDEARAAKERLEKLTEDMERQAETVAHLRDQIGAYAAAEYRTGGVDPTVQLLFADDPDEFLAQMNSAQAFRGQHGETLRYLQAEQKRLVEKQEAVRLKRAELREARVRSERKLAEAEAKYEKGQQLLERLTEEERRRLREIEEQRERDRISRERDRNGDDGGDEPPPPPPPGDGRGATALAFAQAQLGEPYVFGSSGPNSWDCSGLTMMSWRQAGVSLPHSSRQQYAVSTKIARSDLQPGDLVIFYADQHHVGIYAGNNQVVHAPRPGKVVEYISMNYMPVTGTVRPG